MLLAGTRAGGHRAVASTNAALLILTDDGQPGGWFWCLQPERSVWTVFVVVLDVHGEDTLEVTSVPDQHSIQTLGSHRPHLAPTVSISP